MSDISLYPGRVAPLDLSLSSVLAILYARGVTYSGPAEGMVRRIVNLLSIVFESAMEKYNFGMPPTWIVSGQRCIQMGCLMKVPDEQIQPRVN